MSAITDQLDVLDTAILKLRALVAPPAARVLSLAAGANLQAAIDAAQAGDVLELEAGATFVGNYVLRSRHAEAVMIRSAGRYGPGRLNPTTVGAYAKVRASIGGAPAFATEPGTQGWTLSCLEVPGNPGGFGELLQLGDGSTAQTSLDGIPSRFVVDRCYLHGDPVIGQKRGIALNCSDVLITGCHISDIFVIGQDSQAIAGWNGPGQYTITDNYLEAASENILFGGTDAAVPNLVPSDITISGNTLTKKSAWKGKGYNVKNLFELKSARRVVFRDNLVTNVWGDAQVGYAVQLTPRNQDGAAPWSTVEDVLIQTNDFRDMAAGINFLGTDYGYPSGRMKRVQVVANTFTNVDPSAFWGSDKVFQIGDGPEDVTIDGNTVTGANLGSILYFTGGAKSLRLVFTNNKYPASLYGIFGGGSSVGGNPPHAWVDYVDAGTISGNTVTT
jgi:hypothetical protein